MICARRCIEPAHFGVLALPLAEFLALSHGTRCGSCPKLMLTEIRFGAKGCAGATRLR